MTRHLLVIGAQRCGTTYLSRVLDDHPQITMARPARPEPKFFGDRDLWRRGLAWYESTYFSGCTDVAVHGEKSTSYIESAQAAERAAAMLPRADALVMLRDPVARAISNWRFSTASGMEQRPLEQALTENLQGSRSWDPTLTSVSPFAYVERGRYMDYLPVWAERFGERLHVLFVEELAGDAEAVTRLYKVLGVDPGYLPATLDRRVNAAEAIAPDVAPDLRAALRASFVESDRRLREWIGRPLPWDPARRDGGDITANA